MADKVWMPTSETQGGWGDKPASWSDVQTTHCYNGQRWSDYRKDRLSKALGPVGSVGEPMSPLDRSVIEACCPKLRVAAEETDPLTATSPHPLLPDDLVSQALGRALNDSAMLSLLKQTNQWPPFSYVPSPWYQRLWYRIDRYLPRVSVHIGPHTECDCG